MSQEEPQRWKSRENFSIGDLEGVQKRLFQSAAIFSAPSGNNASGSNTSRWLSTV